MRKEIILPDELDKILRENDAWIRPIGEYQVQTWLDWLVMHTQRGLEKEKILQALENYEQNWSW